MIGLMALVYKPSEKDNSVSQSILSYLKRYNRTSACHEGCYFASNSLGKFPEDCLFKENSDYVIETDGVILNSEELYSATEDREKTIFLSFDSGNLSEEISKYRGSFSGIIYNRLKDSICAFTDQFATKTLFYSLFPEGIIISSEVTEIVRIRRLLDLPVEIDLVGAYSLISYGYMYGSHTLVKGVNRIREGTLLNYSNGAFRLERYHSFDIKERNIGFDDAIEQIDVLFRNAVTLQHVKNKKHGFIDVVPLSAGMDCRMTSYVLSSVSDSPVLNFTYSETGQYDQVVPAEMAKNQKNRWIFKSLDNGLDLENIDEAIDISDGLIKYDWPAQLIDFLKLVNTSSWGIIHTGVIGDVVIGSFEKTPMHHRQYRIGDGSFSPVLIPKLTKLLEEMNELPSVGYEMGMLLNRGINGACLGYSRTFRLVAEDLSPFMNVDFAEFCFSLPLEYRRNHKIYYEWVKRKYPQAAKFKHNGIRFDGKISIKYHGRKYTLKSLADVITNKIKRDVIKKGYGMNPQQTWYEENKHLQKTMDSFFNDKIGVLERYQELQNDLRKLYANGTAVEKILAISLVGNYYNYFIRGLEL